MGSISVVPDEGQVGRLTGTDPDIIRRLERIEEKLDRLLASVDTHAERHDPEEGHGPKDG